jgi:Spy/CpxP family protein refolding chaperone
MTKHPSRAATLGALALICGAVQQSAEAQGVDAGGPPSALDGSGQQQLSLTPAQRRAIYAAVTKDKSKTAKIGFSATVGAEVPPMLELYALPDSAVAGNQTAKFFEYTIVQDKVVLVDPTRMRVVDVIGPQR